MTILSNCGPSLGRLLKRKQDSSALEGRKRQEREILLTRPPLSGLIVTEAGLRLPVGSMMVRISKYAVLLILQLISKMSVQPIVGDVELAGFYHSRKTAHLHWEFRYDIQQSGICVARPPILPHILDLISLCCTSVF